MLVMMILAIALMIGSGHRHMGLSGHEIPVQKVDHLEEGSRVKTAPVPAVKERGAVSESTDSNK